MAFVNSSARSSRHSVLLSILFQATGTLFSAIPLLSATAFGTLTDSLLGVQAMLCFGSASCSTRLVPLPVAACYQLSAWSDRTTSLSYGPMSDFKVVLTEFVQLSAAHGVPDLNIHTSAGDEAHNGLTDIFDVRLRLPLALV